MVAYPLFFLWPYVRGRCLARGNYQALTRRYEQTLPLKTHNSPRTPKRTPNKKPPLGYKKMSAGNKFLPTFQFAVMRRSAPSKVRPSPYFDSDYL